jgi:hypothetical protein
MHRVQTLVRFRLPSAEAIRTVFRFGSQRLLVLLWACETLLPVIGPFPQSSHTLAMAFSFYCIFPSADGGLDKIDRLSTHHSESVFLPLFFRRGKVFT